MVDEQEKAGLVARFPVGPDEVKALWESAKELAPSSGHRVRLLEHVISLGTLVNVSPSALLVEVRRLAQPTRQR